MKIIICIFSLEELQICSNNYSIVSVNHDFIHPRLKRLYISKNHFTEWKSICHLGRLFPCLETLIASENPLESFRSHDDDDVNQCLPNLHTLSVDQVQISQWMDIIALTKLPSLHALRIYSAPLLKVCSDFLNETTIDEKISFLGLRKRRTILSIIGLHEEFKKIKW